MLHASRLSFGLALCALALPRTAHAQRITYEFLGYVSNSGPILPAGHWAGVWVWDSVDIVVVVDRAVTGSGSAPTTYAGAVTSTYVSIGTASSNIPLSEDVRVADDVGTCVDELTLDLGSVLHWDGGLSIVLTSTTAACPNPAFGSEAIPTALDPSFFPSSVILLFDFDPSTCIIPIQLTSGTVRIEGDVCADAIALPPTFGTTSYDATAATTDGMDAAGFCDYGPFGDEQNHNDVWFTYTPAVGGCTYVSTLNLAGYDTRLTVYDGYACPDDPARILACVDDELQPATSPFEAGLDVDLVAGVTYTIRLGTPDAGIAAGPGAISIQAGPGADVHSGGANPGAPGCDPFPDVCNGDGGDQAGCTSCPCSNEAPAGTIGGCLNSAGTASRLAASGDPSVSLPAGATTDLRFALSGGPALATCVLLSGDAVAPTNLANPCFGLESGIQAADRDGLRCAVQGVQRHGNRRTSAAGDVTDSTGPSRVWGGEAEPTAGIAAASGFASGQTRYFQVTHRDDPLLVCMRGLNTSQAVTVTFTP